MIGVFNQSELVTAAGGQTYVYTLTVYANNGEWYAGPSASTSIPYNASAGDVISAIFSDFAVTVDVQASGSPTTFTFTFNSDPSAWFAPYKSNEWGMLAGPSVFVSTQGSDYVPGVPGDPGTPGSSEQFTVSSFGDSDQTVSISDGTYSGDLTLFGGNISAFNPPYGYSCVGGGNGYNYATFLYYLGNADVPDMYVAAGEAQISIDVQGVNDIAGWPDIPEIPAVQEVTHIILDGSNPIVGGQYQIGCGGAIAYLNGSDDSTAVASAIASGLSRSVGVTGTGGPNDDFVLTDFSGGDLPDMYLYGSTLITAGQFDFAGPL